MAVCFNASFQPSSPEKQYLLISFFISLLGRLDESVVVDSQCCCLCMVLDELFGNPGLKGKGSRLARKVTMCYLYNCYSYLPFAYLQACMYPFVAEHCAVQQIIHKFQSGLCSKRSYCSRIVSPKPYGKCWARRSNQSSLWIGLDLKSRLLRGILEKSSEMWSGLLLLWLPTQRQHVAKIK